ncbi:MAG: YciC family protein [Thermodesulfobacteriota bacterium]
MMNHTVSDKLRISVVMKPLIEAFRFFRVYMRDIVTFLLYATVPVIIIENFISYYAIRFNFPIEVKHLPIILHFFYQPIYTGGLIYLISRVLEGENWDVKGCLLVGVRFWANLLIVNVISSVMIILGLFAFIIPGVFIFARLSLAEFCVVLDKLSPIDALYHSNKISRDFMWQIIISALLLLVILLGCQLVIHLVIVTLSLENIVTFMVTELLIIILWSMFTVLFFRFYDLANNATRQSDNHENQSEPLNNGR